MGRERHRVFVKSGVTAETSEELLKHHFSAFGTVTDVYIPRSYPGPTPKGFAYVSFENDESVQEAVKEAVHEIEGKHYPVGRAEPRPAERTTWHQEDRKPLHNPEPLLHWPSRYSRSVSPHGLLPSPRGSLPRFDMRPSILQTPRMPFDAGSLGDLPPYGSRLPLPYSETYGLEGRSGISAPSHLLPDERISRSPRIFVGGLPEELVERHIRAHFQKYGAVEDVYFPREKHTGKRRGFCFVRFDSARSANFAASQSPRTIQGYKIGEIKVANERPEDFSNDGHAEFGLNADRFGSGLETIIGPELGYGPDRSRSYKLDPSYYEIPRQFPREQPREFPRELSRDFPREFPRELPREFARELPRDFSSELPRAYDSRLPIRYRPY